MPLLVIGLASALAGRSLRLAVEDVLKPLSSAPPQLEQARQKLAWIVGRDVDGLPAPELLRALAETASENAVDGLFAPLFWMLIGAGLWSLNPALPGPLALAWAFKASSTLDSMLGYRRGRLQWLGTAGARLDDGLTWLPCRLLALSLGQLGPALRDGASDPSPNAGVSQAAYAHALGLQLGGLNRYGGIERAKPLLNEGGRAADQQGVQAILDASQRSALLWLGLSGVVALMA
jgi:adenosylcobinamide-phosphate synthase